MKSWEKSPKQISSKHEIFQNLRILTTDLPTPIKKVLNRERNTLEYDQGIIKNGEDWLGWSEIRGEYKTTSEDVDKLL